MVEDLVTSLIPEEGVVVVEEECRKWLTKEQQRPNDKRSIAAAFY